MYETLRRNALASFMALALVASVLASLIAWAQYGGSISVPNVTFYGTCSNETAGLLFVVGRNSAYHGVVYRVSSLSGSGLQLFAEYSGSKNFGAEFYGCSIVYDSINNRNLLVVGGVDYQAANQNNPQGLIVVYNADASAPTTAVASTAFTFTGGVKPVIRDIVAINASIVGGPSGIIYVYYLSVSGTYVVIGEVNLTVSGGSISLSTPSGILVSSSGNGYGLTWHPYFGNRVGVLWSNSTGLYLNVYNIASSGDLTPVKTITIASPWSGANAAEVARTNPNAPGCLIAAGGNVYFVDGRSLSLSGSYPISGVGSNTSYAALYYYESGREALYIFTYDSSKTYIFAVDLVSSNTAFIDTVASITSTPTGYGDPSLVWVDNSLNIVGKGTPGARPYMVYTAGNRILYYDLSRGGSTPFPIPEPWTVGLASLTVALVVLWASRRHRPEGS